MSWNEPILGDDVIIAWNQTVVVDGVVYLNPAKGSVADLKRRMGAEKITRCDIIGRLVRPFGNNLQFDFHRVLARAVAQGMIEAREDYRSGHQQDLLKGALDGLAECLIVKSPDELRSLLAKAQASRELGDTIRADDRFSRQTAYYEIEWVANVVSAAISLTKSGPPIRADLPTERAIAKAREILTEEGGISPEKTKQGEMHATV